MILSIDVLNASRLIRKRSRRCLVKTKSKEKIDGVAALIDALVAWGGREPEFRSRYEDNPELDVINI